MFKKMVKGVAVRFCCIIICVNLLLLIIPVNTSASQPNVTINLNNPEAGVNVEPGEPGIALFTGTVECDQRGIGQNIQGVVVDLAASTDAGYQATVNPSQLTFRPGETSKPFDVTVVVPPETSVIEVSTLTVTGRARPYPGILVYNVPPATGMIKIEPFMNFQLEYEGKSKCSEPGSKEKFKFYIYNFGNYDESFNITVSETSSNEVLDWDIDFSDSSVDIRSMEYKEITFNVNVPKNADSGRHEIIIKVTNNGLNGTDNTVQSKAISFSIDIEWGVLGLGTYPSIALIIFIIILCVALVIVWKTISRSRLRRRLTY